MSEYVNKIYDELDRLNIVVNDACALSSALRETGNDKLATDLFNMGMTIRRADENMRGLIAKEINSKC